MSLRSRLADDVRRQAARVLRSPRLLPQIDGRHVEMSLIAPPAVRGGPEDELLDHLLAAAARIRSGAVEPGMARIEDRLVTDDQRSWWRAWPGEHYLLLAALVSELGVRRAVEVGTFTGMGTLALLAGGAQHITTFDVVPWDRFAETVLRADDVGGSVQQSLANLSSPPSFAAALDTLAEADLVFIDGPKDWVFEPAFFALLSQHRELLRRPLFVVDDVRTLPLVRTWLGMDWCALDATSLGHWSGTGLARFR